MVEQFLEQKRFSTVTKGDGNYQVQLRQGLGTETAPLYQVAIGAEGIELWAGWHVSFATWVDWRDQVLTEMLTYLTLSVPLVNSISSQFTISVPLERLRKIEEIPELGLLNAFYQRFIPEEFLKRSRTTAIFADEGLNRTITWWSTDSPAPGEESFVFVVRTLVLDDGVDLSHNLASHARQADELFEKFSTGFMSLAAFGSD